METTTSGLILRIYQYSETSLIVHWLTRDLGRIKTIAKGARRPKSSFAGRIDIFFLADIGLIIKESREIQVLKEVRVIDTHDGLRRDVGVLQRAAYYVALVELTTEPSTPIVDIYDLFVVFLSIFERFRTGFEAVLAFEVRLFTLLGVRPDLKGSGLSEGAKRWMRAVCESPLQRIDVYRLNGGQVKEVSDFIGNWCIYHYGRVPIQRQHALEW
ncbi:MAG: DNA repair protein RecO [Verrucomicrobia bacterium]|nr:DNA repair protein RecO [Verrucomicrobiota bacterium]